MLTPNKVSLIRGSDGSNEEVAERFATSIKTVRVIRESHRADTAPGVSKPLVPGGFIINVPLDTFSSRLKRND